MRYETVWKVTLVDKDTGQMVDTRTFDGHRGQVRAPWYAQDAEKHGKYQVRGPIKATRRLP
jgi:hypothetical protein